MSLVRRRVLRPTQLTTTVAAAHQVKIYERRAQLEKERKALAAGWRASSVPSMRWRWSVSRLGLSGWNGPWPSWNSRRRRCVPLILVAEHPWHFPFNQISE